jgi:hypothetical protein
MTDSSKPPDSGTHFPLAAIPPRAAQGLSSGMHEVAVYLAGGTHLRDYLKPLGITGFKSGATGCRDAGRRMEDLRRKRYASLLKRPNDPDDPGIELTSGNEWFLVPMQEEWFEGAALPDRISIRDGVIRLSVPTFITVEMVDCLLHELLQPRSLNVYLDGSEGQARMVEAGYDPAARLHTRYTLMTREPRLSLAGEIYLIRPMREFTDFVILLDVLVATLPTNVSAKG